MSGVGVYRLCKRTRVRKLQLSERWLYMWIIYYIRKVWDCGKYETKKLYAGIEVALSVRGKQRMECGQGVFS